MFYDFRNGVTSEFLLDKLRARMRGTSKFEVDPIQDIAYQEIEIINNSFIHKKGEDELYMFAYKKRYQTVKFESLPKYHIVECETRETYSGFRFANHMPVEIYCINQRISLGANNLDLCKNCIKKINLYSMGTSDIEWFDVILSKADSREYGSNNIRFDGYTRDWGHVSKAYRFKHGFICEECGIDMSQRKAEFFCEVHHIDGNKINNKTENLKCLCVKCHSNVDERHRINYSKDQNLMKLNQFKMLFDTQ